jgi:hypothetical protein
MSAIDIAARIPEAIFGILLIAGICAFWMDWFKDE